eukprot:7735101-Ditylum_brightwellii.AAC.1
MRYVTHASAFRFSTISLQSYSILVWLFSSVTSSASSIHSLSEDLDGLSFRHGNGLFNLFGSTWLCYGQGFGKFVFSMIERRVRERFSRNDTVATTKFSAAFVVTVGSVLGTAPCKPSKW